MKNEENKVNFDLSALSLTELIELYTNITGFLQLLKEKTIVNEEKAGNQNE